MQYGQLLTDLLENANFSFCPSELRNAQIDSILIQAVEDVLKSGSMTPLVKEELKTKIQADRLQKGKEELVVVFEKEKKFELREDEKRRIEKRKEANRLAAIRFRKKRKGNELQLEEECEELVRRNRKLLTQLHDLEEEKNQLLEAISDIRSPT